MEAAKATNLVSQNQPEKILPLSQATIPNLRHNDSGKIDIVKSYEESLPQDYFERWLITGIY
jgi:hypothetical protein